MQFRRFVYITPFLTLFAFLALTGCPSKYPDVNSRATARQAAVSMSWGVDAVVDACIAIMRVKAETSVDDAKAFGRQCYAIVKPMGEAVSAAAQAVDNWDTQPTAFDQVACTAKVFALKFWPAAKALISQFDAPPAAIDDVVLFVGVLASSASPNCQVN